MSGPPPGDADDPDDSADDGRGQESGSDPGSSSSLDSQPETDSESDSEPNRPHRDRNAADDRTPVDDAPPASDETRTRADDSRTSIEDPSSRSGPPPTANNEPSTPPNRRRGDRVTIENDGVIRWFLRSENGTVVFARDVLSSVAIVAVIGLILFAFSGVWPPLVAVESGSMEPSMERGDLIFVVDGERYTGDGAIEETGIVPLENGQESGHERLGGAGDVIVFRPDGADHRTPVIHRAHFWVEEGENWVDTKADDDVIGDATCGDVRTCPAPHDGFVTKGDANDGYDQYGNGISNVVKPEWVTGKAMYRIPYLGHVRLTFDAILGETGTGAPSPVIETSPVPTDSLGLEKHAVGVEAGLTGAAGVGGVGAGIAVAVGRHRN